ncbi:MAG: FHA domain-containing protein, partial [Acidobacteriota bacterium]
MHDTWIHPHANEDGFTPFEKVKADARAMDLAQFMEAYPRPALRAVDDDAPSSGLRRMLEPVDRGVQLLTERIEGVAILRYLGKVAFLAKRPGNPYQHLISIGRSQTNDITVAVESVSKVHGYFVLDDDTWRFNDHGSTNGSRIGRRALAKNEKSLLSDGDTLKLGLDVCFRFLAPHSLYREA